MKINQQEFYQALTDRKGGIPEPLHETVAVLSYEVGRMMENAMYSHWATDRAGKKIRRALVQSELIDAIAQCVLISEALGKDFEEMKAMGIEKAMERFTGKEKKQ